MPEPEIISKKRNLDFDFKVSDTTIKSRKMLFIFTIIFFMVFYLNLVPKRIPSFDITIDELDIRIAKWFLILTLIFYMVSYIFHLLRDIISTYRQDQRQNAKIYDEFKSKIIVELDELAYPENSVFDDKRRPLYLKVRRMILEQKDYDNFSVGKVQEFIGNAFYEKHEEYGEREDKFVYNDPSLNNKYTFSLPEIIEILEDISNMVNIHYASKITKKYRVFDVLFSIWEYLIPIFISFSIGIFYLFQYFNTQPELVKICITYFYRIFILKFIFT